MSPIHLEHPVVYLYIIAAQGQICMELGHFFTSSVTTIHVSKQWIHCNEKNLCNENSSQWKGIIHCNENELKILMIFCVFVKFDAKLFNSNNFIPKHHIMKTARLKLTKESDFLYFCFNFKRGIKCKYLLQQRI